MSTPLRFARRRRLLAVGLVSLVAGTAARAQVRETWRVPLHFGAPLAVSAGAGIAAHPSGGYVIGGWKTPGWNSHDSSPLVVRLDAQGNVLWSRDLQIGSQQDSVAGVAVGAQGAVYASISRFWSGAGVIGLAKLDGSGNLQWLAPAPPTVSGLTLVNTAPLLDAAENSFLAGTSFDASFHMDMVVLSYDAHGAQRFATRIDGPVGGQDTLNAICRDPAGNVFVAGIMDGIYSYGGAYHSDFGIAKLDANGSIQWVRTYDHFGLDWAQVLESVVCDSSGNVYACGGARNWQTGDKSEIVISCDTNGQLRWVRSSPWYSGVNRVAVDRWDRVIVLASALTQYDALGNSNWRVVPPETGGQLVVDANGDITIASKNSGTWVTEYVAQYSPSGSLRWWKPVGGATPATSEQISSLCLGPDGRIAFTGSVGTLGSQYDLFTVELGDQSRPFCFGDGTATACPCGNASAAGAQAGCLNSNSIGARLTDAGDASIANDTLALTASEVTGPAFFVQGSGQAADGVVFGDGLLCLSGTITRLGVVFPVGTTAAYPGGTSPSPIHVAGMAAAGDTLHYQAWYRDAAAFCSAATFDLTQGLTVTWSP